MALTDEAMEAVFENAVGTSMGVQHALENALPGLPGLRTTLVDEIFVTGVIAGVGLAAGEGIAGKTLSWSRSPMEALRRYKNKVVKPKTETD